MDQSRDKLLKFVFRVRRLPNRTQNHEDVSKLLAKRLGDIRSDSIHVFSLATSLNSSGKPPSKVATVMFASLPRLVQEANTHDEWLIPFNGFDECLLLDTHFMGMTPLNDVDAGRHVAE